MIARETIDGRKATVAYMTRRFEPADKAEAELVKVRFDDGEVVFLVPRREGSHAPTT